MKLIYLSLLILLISISCTVIAYKFKKIILKTLEKLNIVDFPLNTARKSLHSIYHIEKIKDLPSHI